MKKYILPILLTSLLLSACGFGNKEEIFERKIDCLEMKDDMLKFAKTVKPQIWQIDEIFFSTSKNSCFFVTRETRNIDQGITRDFVTLFDYLNQKMLIEAPISNGDGRYLDDGNFEKNIKELKGEKINNTEPLPDGHEGVTSSGNKYKVTYE